MAESTLSLALADLRTAIAEMVYGGNATYATLTAAEQTRVDSVLKSGLRQFYHPPPDPSGRTHEWTFLTTTTTLSLLAAYTTGTIASTSGVVTLTGGTFPTWAASGMLRVSGIDYSINTRDSGTQVTLDDLTYTVAALATYEVHQDDYDLPDAFGFLVDSPPTYAMTDSVGYEVQVVGENRIRAMRQQSSIGGKPSLVAVRSINKATASGTRQEIMFYPRVTEAATLTYRYRARPDALGASDTYPWGASDHSETILASCLAAAERLVEEARGIYWDDFQRQLAASIAFDSRANRPERMGYNGDNSDDSGFSVDLWGAVLPYDYRNYLTGPVTHKVN